jgi:hypothetical protein
VLVAVIAVVILTVAVGTAVVRAQIRARTLAGTVDGVAILSSVVIDRSFTLTDVARGMNPVNRSALNADVILLKRRGALDRLAIWSLPQGRLVYTDIPASETVKPRPDVMARARAGKAFVAARARRADGPVV